MERLGNDEVARQLEGTQWRLEDGAIVRDLELANFAEALAFANRVGEAAEAANHHPDILIHGYKHLRLTLSTHTADGLTDLDVALARTIDGL